MKEIMDVESQISQIPKLQDGNPFYPYLERRLTDGDSRKLSSEDRGLPEEYLRATTVLSRPLHRSSSQVSAPFSNRDGEMSMDSYQILGQGGGPIILDSNLRDTFN